MRRTMQYLLAFTLLLGFGRPFPAALDAHDEFRFVGVITKTDLPKNLITVKYKEFDGKDEIVTVTLNAKTKITRDNKAVPKSQLRATLNVVVDALGCEDVYDATAIKIVPATPR